ncbi:MAG: HAD-IIB family hydrolase [Verrucomicrobiota bacterium]
MFIFSTDIDGTIYDSLETATHFAEFWEALTTGSEQEGKLIFNTGRSIGDTLGLLSEVPLPQPDFIIGGVGTEIYSCEQSEKIDDWESYLVGDGWEADGVSSLVERLIPDIEAQPPECNTNVKRSWFWNDRDLADIAQLEKSLSDEGIVAQVVYSSQRDLDILPRRANKGNALHWLCDRLDFGHAKIIVAGDSGNDLSMFGHADVHGIVVANASAELQAIDFKTTGHFLAQAPCAYGVVEGLRHFLTPSIVA